MWLVTHGPLPGVKYILLLSFKSSSKHNLPSLIVMNNFSPQDFPDSPVVKESACNAGDPDLIPLTGRSTGEGIGYPLVFLGFPCGSVVKESACNAGDLGSIPGLGRSPGEGKGLENSMDYTVHGVANSQTIAFTFFLLSTLGSNLLWEQYVSPYHLISSATLRVSF